MVGQEESLEASRPWLCSGVSPHVDGVFLVLASDRIALPWAAAARALYISWAHLLHLLAAAMVGQPPKRAGYLRYTAETNYRRHPLACCLCLDGVSTLLLFRLIRACDGGCLTRSVATLRC